MKDYRFNLLVLLYLLFFFSCKNSKDYTKLDSDDFSERKDRIEKLKENIVYASEIIDAEFELFNVNGFTNTRNTSVPGASSWNYQFVVKIDTSNIQKWLNTFTETKNVVPNLQLISEITKKRKENWKTISKPKFYIRQNDESTFIVLYEKEGIIFKSVVNL
ncbi:MAG: hypothetical protein IPK18_00670 [Sphingobacteriales bacterium]|jgi:hypothetical protein|nr:MAG: hypothetical protein IPK18_00670 [Sphingobacteriales bacterium]